MYVEITKKILNNFSLQDAVVSNIFSKQDWAEISAFVNAGLGKCKEFPKIIHEISLQVRITKISKLMEYI